MRRSVLIIEDEAEVAAILGEDLTSLGCEVRMVPNAQKAKEALTSASFDVVFSDIHMPGKSGLQLLSECREIVTPFPAWVFITADASPDILQKACFLGAIDAIQKPFSKNEIARILSRIGLRKQDSIHEIMDIVQAISGIRLGNEKRLLVETRLMRRARVLGLESVEKYKAYFQQHRETEVDELISSVTTHTTSFFREPDHFDFFHDRVLPELFKAKEEKPLRFWSAACSTGEEVYSLAISFLEYLRAMGLSHAVSAEFIGTDIDFNSVRVAQQGIYEAEAVARLNPELVRRYFDVGSGELDGLLKVKDSVHRLCKFEQMNLLSTNYPIPKAESIFIRNVLIYFQPEEVKSIALRLERHLQPNGYLFLGHSESLMGLETSYSLVGNSVYRPKRGEPAQAPLRVLVVDDSPTIRKMLRRILNPAHGFEVVAEAANPLEAERIRATARVDLITLDIHMPEMDGITYLKRLQGTQHPPIVMLSSMSPEDAVNTLKCLELGAVDYLEKPSGLDLILEGDRIRASLKAACSSRRKSTSSGSAEHSEIIRAVASVEGSLLAIGASTGGTEAIRNILERLPQDSPPILIVQHIPPVFSKAFAARLNETCKIRVKEAVNGDEIVAGQAYIAPGGKQMRVILGEKGLRVEINDDPAVNRHRPSVDYLFESLARIAGHFRISAALLTGMGADGARGLKWLRDAGANTIAQDEDSCVVFGMPKEAIALGGAVEVLPLPSIAYHLFKAFEKPSKVA